MTGGRPMKRPSRAIMGRTARLAPSVTSTISTTLWSRTREESNGSLGLWEGAKRVPQRRQRSSALSSYPGSSHDNRGAQRETRGALRPHCSTPWPPHPFHRQGPLSLHDLLSKICDKTATCALFTRGTRKRR